MYNNIVINRIHNKMYVHIALLLVFFSSLTIAKLIKLDPDNLVIVRGRIDSEMASKVIYELVKKKSKEIYVYIDSYGGSVDSGLQIIQAMESLQSSGTNVHTIANDVASMGFAIHQAGKLRYVRPWSVLMQHQLQPLFNLFGMSILFTLYAFTIY